MAEQTALATKKSDAPAEWGTRAEIGAVADRLSTMLPNAKEMSQGELLAAAQYCRLMDVNPFRGEVYFYKNRGRLCVVDGYKSLVRWAKNKMPYVDKFEPLPLDDGQIHKLRCWILPDDRKAEIREWVELGAPWRDAFEMVATFADGVVTEADTISRKSGKAVDPPVGWTWEQVARKRALKNALNLSHGAPSPREMADISYDVNGVKTIPEDWSGAEQLTSIEAERLAEMRAADRERLTVWEQMTTDEQQAKLEENTEAMRGPADFEGFDTPLDKPSTGPKWEAVPEADEEPAEKSDPITGDSLLIVVNDKADGYYNHTSHLMNAVQAELDPDWTWPDPHDREAWNEAYEVAVAYAQKEKE